MKHDRTKSLYQYWDQVRAGRRAPRRLEIEPSAIASHLPNVFILERVDATAYRFRLAGTHLCGYCQRELRGRLFTSLWPSEEHDAVQTLMSSVTEQGAGAVAGLEGKEPQGRGAQFELLLLPLATSQGALDRIIGSISATDSPYWLGHWPIVSWSIKSTRIVWPDGEPENVIEHLPVSVPNSLASIRERLTVIEGGLSRSSK